MTVKNHIIVDELEIIYNSLGCVSALLDELCSSNPEHNCSVQNLVPFLEYIERDFAPIVDKFRSGDLLVLEASP